MTINPGQINMYPRVSNWYETNFVEYRENSVFDKWHIEVVYFEADAEYSYGNTTVHDMGSGATITSTLSPELAKSNKRIMGGAYQRVEITDKLTGNFWEDAFLGETAEADANRWANDIVTKIKYGKVK
ncbi:MAG: hypothetical protein RLZZ184_1520 [Cyanobacteriota bacterium]|jgi:hypothetical protein